MAKNILIENFKEGLEIKELGKGVFYVDGGDYTSGTKRFAKSFY